MAISLADALKDALKEGDAKSVVTKLSDSSGEWGRVIVGGTGSGGADKSREGVQSLRGGSEVSLLSSLGNEVKALMTMDAEESYSVSKRAVQAVRALWKAGRYTVFSTSIMKSNVQ